MTIGYWFSSCTLVARNRGHLRSRGDVIDFVPIVSFINHRTTHEATISRCYTAAPVPPAISLGRDVGHGAGGVDDGWRSAGRRRRGQRCESRRSGVGYRRTGFAAASIPDRGRSARRGGGGIPACHRTEG